MIIQSVVEVTPGSMRTFAFSSAHNSCELFTRSKYQPHLLHLHINGSPDILLTKSTSVREVVEVYLKRWIAPTWVFFCPQR